MDQIKIGKFIADSRKAQGLTQKELAEQLGLTDKSVSKWECGKGMPDHSIMISLCSILNINVNELLSGEKLAQDNYTQKAEENIMNLIQESSEAKKNKKRKFISALVGELCLLLVLAYTIILSGGFISITQYFWDLPSLLVIIAADLIILISLRLRKDFGRGIAFFFQSKTALSYQQLELSYQAITVVMLSSALAGLLTSLTAVIILLHLLTEPTVIGPNLSIACISVFYSVIINLLLLPVWMKLKLAILRGRDAEK